MLYVDVILPVPLEGLFTYALPDHLSEKVRQGMRVLVPFGKTKTYTAMAVEVHERRPLLKSEGGMLTEIKNVIEVLDDTPMMLPLQLRLWSWIADYYLCPIGDVYKAAMPGGLKQEDGYRPKTETYIRLTQNFRSEQSLHVALNMLMRAPKQQSLLSVYLTISGWDDPEGEHKEVTREELINVSHCNATHVRALVDRGIMETYDVEVGRLNVSAEAVMDNMKPLSDKQQQAYDEILSGDDVRKPVLLHGVTGSGKTEVYIHLIKDAIDRGEQVLYLLPEIALTVQIMQRLHRVFGDRLGIYHSRYSDAERVEIWKKQMSASPYDVLLGARSAVLLPFTRLGLIIIDEEHETSFKQQDPAPRYHARSAALVLAQMTGARVVMGTATPSVESYHNAKNGKYRLVRMSERFRGLQLPKIEVVDVADMRRRKMMQGAFSPRLLEAIDETLKADKQVILFQNRRGFAPVAECHTCGWTPRCQYCDVTLTMHKTLNQLTCHYCGYTYSVPVQCPECKGHDLSMRGYGTEKVEEELQMIFPEARISRMDLDTTRTKNAYERIISDFGCGRSNVLVGTQMVTKGLDFGRVALVGILSADTMINYPDFRAYEHAFQMMSQVSGRAGRKDSQGLVILQTTHPDLPVIQQVVDNNYDAFFADVSGERSMFRYPPYSRVVYVYLRHAKDNIVDSAAIEMGSRLRSLLPNRVLGPDKPSVARVKSLNIRKIVLKLELTIDLKRVRQCLRQVREAVLADKRYSALQIYYDVDPL